MENCLSSDLEDDGADQEEHHDPADGDQESSVHRDPVQTPASRHDSSQSFTRECLWQHVADIPDTRRLSKSRSKFQVLKVCCLYYSNRVVEINFQLFGRA